MIFETCQKHFPSYIFGALIIKNELFSQEEEEEEKESEEEDYGPEQPFKESECDCALCQCLNTIHNKWAKWEPQTPIEILLKKHIDTIKS